MPSGARPRPRGVEGREEDRGRRDGRKRRATVALPIVARLVSELEAVNHPATWWEHLDGLARIRASLGIHGPAVDALELALEDHGAVLDGLGQAETPVSWESFVGESRRLARELELVPIERPGAVRVTTVDRAVGVAARHVILANLTEGSFPAREAIEPDPTGDDEAMQAGFARELRRFLRVVDTAREGLTLVYPTTDEKGQSLLVAGFLDEAERLFPAAVWGACTQAIKRLGPVLPPELSQSPAEKRVRAVAEACQGGTEELDALCRERAHHRILLGSAAALRLDALRSARRTRFGPYEGLLHDREVARKIAESFAATRPAFSPSQLESLAFCPFQFFQRYVLRLEPMDQRDELEDDLTARGSLIHRALETLHNVLGADESEASADRVGELLRAEVEKLIDAEIDRGSPVAAGLRRIEAEHLRKVAGRYVAQFQAYRKGPGELAACFRCELVFGRRGSDHPPLILGDPPDGVQLQGSIDRVDVVAMDDGTTLFRVIDYKSGSSPDFKKLKQGLALQLPLYAMAVERHGLAGPGAIALDAGYWGLREQGYKPLTAMARVKDGTVQVEPRWEAMRPAIEAYVQKLVGHMRAAAFPVHPRADDCTRFCDYRTVCRIAQARKAGKRWEDQPVLELEP